MVAHSSDAYQEERNTFQCKRIEYLDIRSVCLLLYASVSKIEFHHWSYHPESIAMIF